MSKRFIYRSNGPLFEKEQREAIVAKALQKIDAMMAKEKERYRESRQDSKGGSL